MAKLNKSTIVLVGDAGLAQALKTIREVTAKRIMRKAIAQGLVPIEREAERLVPVRTGELKKAIIRRVSKRALIGRVMVNPSRKIVYNGRPHQPSKIAHLVEFGTKHAAAHPFLRPALDSQRGAALSEVTRVAAAEFDKEASKAAAKGRAL